MRKWRAKKGEDYIKYRKEYDAKRYQKKKEEIKKQTKEYYYENWEARQIMKNKWNKDNEDKVREYQKEYHQEHREERLSNMREYHQENKERDRPKRRAYKNNKYHTDPNYRIKEAYSSRIRGALKKGSKHAGTLELLGCTIPELREWLEKRFFPGMTWDNFGDWNIEHIQPCCAFDLTKISHQKYCFHYLNLRPYWANDNLVKEKTMDLSIILYESSQNLNSNSI